MALFQSSTKSRGVWVPKNGRMRTEHTPYDEKLFADHIDGKEGLGLVPICDGSVSYWGAIDIDCHGENEPIDIKDMYAKVEAAGLPLLVCRSKSGGAHLYLFMSEAVEAKVIRAYLRLMANKVGHPAAEVFPKQDVLSDTQLGNWINLPYHNAEDTPRYCFVKKPLSVQQFIETAEEMRCTASGVEKILLGDHSEAPPCVQQMMSGKIPSGYRNEAMFAIASYMKKAFPEDWMDRCRDANITTFEQPLQGREVETLLKSVGRRDYKYRCQQEPCKGFCQAKLCMKRTYGIKPEDDPEASDRAGMIMMEIQAITKVLTEPPIYYVKVSGHDVKVRADQLYNPQAMCLVMLEQADRVVYPMKPKEWHNQLATCIQTIQREEAPEDASEAGMIRVRLREFLKKARDDTDGKDGHFLSHGHPVVMEEEGVKYVFFKGTSFVDYLRRTKSSTMRGNDLWAALRAAGVEYLRTRKFGIKGGHIWRARHEVEEAQDTPVIKSEF